ncbi:hypothetical protein [Nitrospirillum iridis]|uniref:Uncharacterized protein n=1 Tax=Nitrospirillum iridis TaxID=765888 RepID=A0A7X0AWB0_9PROT|nr:hypothetical protein [Nitrospirillum iridis]MBB6249864.1 hypothetical protein [Nitrospirillum iridis]
MESMPDEEASRLAERAEAWSWLVDILGQMLIALLEALWRAMP